MGKIRIQDAKTKGEGIEGGTINRFMILRMGS